MIGAYYDTVFNTAQDQGLSIETAADHAATSFLDGKPSGLGKRKCSGADRHAAFWSSHFLRALPAHAWQQESLSLALARYLGQDRVTCPEIVAHVAMLAPDVLQQAARHAGLVLRQESPRWREIEALADSQAETFSEFVQVFRIFKEAHQLRVDEVKHLHESLAELTPLDLLAYNRLHQYWLYRGMDALMASPDLLALVSPAHLEANLQAFAKAMGTWLRLQEVYGIAEQVRTEAGSAVDVFRALLATELMTAFYIEDFLRPYHQHLQQFGHPWLALGRLAFGGLLQPEMQNRSPITWSDRASAGLTAGSRAGDHRLDRRHLHRVGSPGVPGLSQDFAGRDPDCTAR